MISVDDSQRSKTSPRDGQVAHEPHEGDRVTYFVVNGEDGRPSILLREVCDSHGHVSVQSADPMGSWRYNTTAADLLRGDAEQISPAKAQYIHETCFSLNRDAYVEMLLRPLSE